MTSEEPNKELKKTKEEEGVPHLVSPIHTIANQVGEHVLSAMKLEETVAVLTTITGSSHGQQVISIPLTAEHVHRVHGLIEEIHQSNEPERVPCVGFHCYLEEEESEEE